MSRTIGVITKMDRAEDEDKIVKILENESLPLALGYFGVINRSQEQVTGLNQNFKLSFIKILGETEFLQFQIHFLPNFGKFLKNI